MLIYQRVYYILYIIYIIYYIYIYIILYYIILYYIILYYIILYYIILYYIILYNIYIYYIIYYIIYILQVYDVWLISHPSIYDMINISSTVYSINIDHPNTHFCVNEHWDKHICLCTDRNNMLPQEIPNHLTENHGWSPQSLVSMGSIIWLCLKMGYTPNEIAI